MARKGSQTIKPETMRKIKAFIEQLNAATKDEECDELPSEIKDLNIYQLNAILAIANDSTEGFRTFLRLLIENIDPKSEIASEIRQIPARIEKEPSYSLRSHRVRKYLVPNNKVSNLLPTGLLGAELTEVIVSKERAKKPVTTKVMLSYDEVQITGKQKFTAYDRVVHNAVVSLYEAGNTTFTVPMVYRTMNGLTEGEYISPQALGSVIKSLDKSRFMRIFIDFTSEAKMYRREVENVTYEGYLLAADKITVKTGGELITGYHLFRKPALYEYSQISGQIITVPVKVLNTKKAVNSTDDVIVIREYIIRQIEWMRGKRSVRSQNITYQDIWNELGLELTGQPLNDKTFKLRRNIKAVLKAWIDEKYIKTFTEYKEGKEIKGLIITI